MQHAQDFRPFSSQRATRKPDCCGARAARAMVRKPRSAKKHVVGPDAQAHRLHHSLERRQSFGVCRHAAEHDVGMAADIFCAGLDRQIDAFFEGAGIKRRRPGIVHQHYRAFIVRDACDGGNVLHLEALRAGHFDEHRARVRLEQFVDGGADQRIVIRCLDAHALEHAVAEIAGGPVDAVGDQDVVARAGDREQRG